MISDTGFSPKRNAGAVISRCHRYRYALWRYWDRSLAPVVFICLNPSTADARRDDPTLVRCMGYARAWGYGGVVTANLFAWRATDPRELRSADDPVGPRNNHWLRRLTTGMPLVVAAWGNSGNHLDRDTYVRRKIAGLHYLRLTAKGQPAHPLYLPGSLEPTPLPVE
jgi:hypothetical protein